MKGGVAVLKIGGSSEVEVGEKKVCNGQSTNACMYARSWEVGCALGPRDGCFECHPSGH